MNHVENYMRYKEDPWAFLMECVYTLDQVNKKTPIKTLPDREYGELYCKLWVKYPLLAVPKSRRMTMSWYTIGLYVWDTIFHSGRFNAFVSKKEDDANELIERAKFIIDHIPADKIPAELIPKYRNKFCVLDFYEIKSKLQGFPQGADQLRQFTFSGIFGDESAFWENAQEFYSASFPTIDGGGRMTLVSSPAPGFFKKLCFDAMDKKGEINVEEYSPAFSVPGTGCRVWLNKKNRFMVFEIHYTADPMKRDPAYKESIKNSMPLMEYLREYELHWDTFAGFPVYPEFQKLHVMADKPVVQAGIPMLIGFDFGLTPACVIGQMQEDQLVIFEEMVEINMGAARFYEQVSQHIRMYYPTHSDLKKDWLCFIDPAGIQKAQSNETTCAQELAGPDGKGFVVRPGPVAFEARRKAVVEFLRKLTPSGPAFQLYSPGCPMIYKGFEGGYRFSDKDHEIEKTKLHPIKDAYSHPHDALQYLCAGIQASTNHLKRTVPRPTYTKNDKQVRRYGS
jgi:hypothetical protein